VDAFIFLCFKIVLGVLRILPHKLSLLLLELLIRVYFRFSSRSKKVALKNLKLVFGDDKELATRVWHKSHRELARLIIDLSRARDLSANWIDRHVTLRRIGKAPESDSKLGTLFVTGHLGNFELLGFAIRHFWSPISVVMRDMGFPALNRWWIDVREKCGNECVSRQGGLRAIIKSIRSGKGVGILFDQNVTRKNAVFVDWFGREAATSGAVAMTIIMTKCPVEVISIRCLSDDKYEVVTEAFSFDDILQNESLDIKEKTHLITQKLSEAFCQHIRNFPEGWFWMHRRWKTAPTDEQETFYA